MVSCIYSGHCFEFDTCDESCPALAQVSYLLERSGIAMNSEVFHTKPELLAKYSAILKKSEGQTKAVIDSNTSQVAELITYCGICENWKGSQLHCTVYNLKFSQYLDAIQKSWGNPTSDNTEADYLKIWATNARILIISNIDYVNFKDFQCQTLLSLIQTRANYNLTTIIVSPPVSSLVGDSPFFGKLTALLTKSKVV